MARDDILTNIMLYWVTGTITSSTRLYFESRQNPSKPGAPPRVDTPTAVAMFPAELAHPRRVSGIAGMTLRRAQYTGRLWMQHLEGDSH